MESHTPLASLFAAIVRGVLSSLFQFLQQKSTFHTLYISSAARAYAQNNGSGVKW